MKVDFINDNSFDFSVNPGWVYRADGPWIAFPERVKIAAIFETLAQSFDEIGFRSEISAQAVALCCIQIPESNRFRQFVCVKERTDFAPQIIDFSIGPAVEFTALALGRYNGNLIRPYKYFPEYLRELLYKSQDLCQIFEGVCREETGVVRVMVPGMDRARCYGFDGQLKGQTSQKRVGPRRTLQMNCRVRPDGVPDKSLTLSL
jgi:hypothetical protein